VNDPSSRLQFFRITGEATPSDDQLTVLHSMREVLHGLDSLGVRPSNTSAEIDGHVLRLMIHGRDREVEVEARVERSGEIGLYCPPLGPDFYFKFNDLYEPWESTGDLRAAEDLLRALLEGRVEGRLKTVRGRLVRSEFFLTERDHQRRSLGVWSHLGGMPWTWLLPSHTEVRRLDVPRHFRDD
jgi:hypothetical protein